MLNSVYDSKTMENWRRYVRLKNNEKDFLKYTSRPTHIIHKVFDKNYAAIHEIKPVLTLNKPTYVGFTALELSKWFLYDFHSNCIKGRFDAELLFTDTNSLTYETKSEDAREEFFKYKLLLDFAWILKKRQSSMKVKIKWLLWKSKFNTKEFQSINLLD